jgi:hypothetical protein
LSPAVSAMRFVTRIYSSPALARQGRRRSSPNWPHVEKSVTDDAYLIWVHFISN